jgi:transcriptional regulator with XRE-family HTH domain
MSVTASRPPVGAMLRDWRLRRRVSQLELALDAGVSSRHLSFVETGRSRPSAEMVLHLAEQLDVPLRDRNQLLLAAGYAPAFAQRDLDAPELGPVRDAIDQVLRGHEPYPALVVDRHWGLVAANRPLGALVAGVDEQLLEPPVNVLRLSLHPAGVARIVNLGEWRSHLLDRLAAEALASGDPALTVLHDELVSYPGGESTDGLDPGFAEIAVPLRLRHHGDELRSSARRRASPPRSTSPSPSCRSSPSSPPTGRRRRRCARSLFATAREQPAELSPRRGGATGRPRGRPAARGSRAHPPR